jgi:hypothetical protein
LANANKRGPKTDVLAKRKERKHLMDNLQNHSIDLLTYLKAIGCSTFDKRIQNLELEDIGPDSDDDDDDDEVVQDRVESSIMSNRHSLAGAELRNLRNLMNEDAPQEPQPSEEFKMTQEDGYALAPDRLQGMNMQLSPSQRRTLEDGNCLLYSLLDQLQYDAKLCNFATDHQQLRLKLVDLLGFFISTDRFCWPFGKNPTPAMWQEDMRRDFTQGDSTLVHLAAHVLGRPIIIIPVCAEEGEMRIEPGVVTTMPPLYLLYFSERSFISGHYQSIRPLEATTGPNRSLSIDFGSEMPSNLTLPDISLPQESRSRRPRDLSYMDQSNVVETKRKRNKRD